MKKKLTKSEIRTTLLNIITEIDRVSKILNVNYFLTYGTLLGAIRHKGFIPWDDDVDLGLMRNDYEILIKNFNHYADSRYKLIHYSNTPNYIWPFAKIIDTHTTLKEYTVSPKCEYGLYVDLFVFDYVNFEAESEKKKYIENIIKFNRIMMITDFQFAPHFRKFYNLWILLHSKYKKKYKYLFANPINNLREWDNYLKNYTNGTPTDTVLPVFASYPSARIINNMFKTNWLITLIKTEFEGIMLPIPKNYHEILTIMYGDYMQLPPENKQKGEHYKSVKWR